VVFQISINEIVSLGTNAFWFLAFTKKHWVNIFLNWRLLISA